MKSRATTLGEFIQELMDKKEYSNRSLADAAGVSEGAVRNILKHGVEKGAKDPDARTLNLLAEALEVDAIRLFRLAGYIPPAPPKNSVRAEYLATMFDTLPATKQDAVLGVLHAMVDDSQHKSALEQMREAPANPFSGVDEVFEDFARMAANALIAEYKLINPVDVNSIPANAEFLHYKWAEMPRKIQERIKALIRHKLSLDYDPTMVDPEWRK